uniref:ParB-like partition protein n=1 Tax=Leptospirillum ferrodiazotrophum TaxID=412449 RepID=C6HTU9_9BACT|nr:MAG: ParB-like partition protein [Leptospirillum ferrodiazotrophum]
MAKKSKFLNDLDFLTKGTNAGATGGAPASGSVQTLPLDRIRFDPDQPRKSMSENTLQELADSISRHGVLEPVLVRPEGDDWILVCGERRVRAAGLAGLEQIPAVVREMDIPEVRLVQLIENIQREDLPPLAIARALSDLLKTYGMTQEACARALGKSQTYVSRHLALLQSDDLTMRALESGAIRDPEAVTLLNRMPPEAKKEILDRAIETKTPVSVRTVREELERSEAPVQRDVPRSGEFTPARLPEAPVARSEELPPYGQEIPIESAKHVPARKAGDADPVVAVRLSLSVWRKLLDRLGLDPDAGPEEIQERLESVE